jgi:hypothetical protein
MTAKQDYFKDTETLLYIYPSLKHKVVQDAEDLKKGAVQLPDRSKDILCFRSADGMPYTPDEEAELQSYMASIERTRREVQRIEAALRVVEYDKFFEIIPMRYWDGMEPWKIAEELCFDERTYRRHKNRLVRKVMVALFGADAM